MGTKSALGNKRQLTNQIAGKDASLFFSFFWKTQSSLKQRHRWMCGIHICYPTRWICYKIWYAMPDQCEMFSPEVEFSVEDGVPLLSRGHVLVDLGDGNEEVVLVADEDPGEEDDEAADGGVLKVRDLELARPELHPPPDLGVGRGRLETHRLEETVLY